MSSKIDIINSLKEIANFAIAEAKILQSDVDIIPEVKACSLLMSSLVGSIIQLTNKPTKGLLELFDILTQEGRNEIEQYLKDNS